MIPCHFKQVHPLQSIRRTQIMVYFRYRYLICSEWVKNLQMSMLAFDIAQFFPSLNYRLSPIILDKASFDSKISSFFSNYLISRKTQYLWNIFISSFFYVDIGVGQESTLSPILSALYLSPLFCIFEKRTKPKHLYLFSSIYK